MFRFFLLIFLLACVADVANAQVQKIQSTVESSIAFDKQVTKLIRAHCATCHGGEATEADLSLLELKFDFSEEKTAEAWANVLDKLERGEMPPEGEGELDPAQRKAWIAWLKRELEKGIQASSTTETPMARRLTNVEYENTIRDLVGFRMKLIDMLPKDPFKPYRFNNTPDLMRLGPEQINRYLEAARKVMASAIVDSEKPEVHQTKREWKPLGIDRGLGLDEIGVWGNRRGSPAGGMQLKSFPQTGEYRIRIKASAILPKGVSEMPLRLVMGYGGLEENQSTYRIEPVGTIRLSNSPDDAKVFTFTGRIENHPVRPPRPHRNRTLPASITITPQNLYDDGTLNDDRDFGRTRNISFPRAVVEWIEFEAPLTETWPPEHHTRILFESPLRENDPQAYVRQVIDRFMSRAYRRPATAPEVERFVKIYSLVKLELKTLEASMRETLALVLVSPQFLFHTVAHPETTSAQFELANKLSYFLWATMPDKALLELASKGELGEPDVIEQQVRRMFADERSLDFVRNFSMQWLSLKKMKTVPINRELFPRFLYYVPRGERAGTEEPYRPTIRDHMIEETVGFIHTLIQRNRSVLEIVDSDFAFLNQPLAAHYGINGVEGSHFREVPIDADSQLGGLLTQGSVLIGNGTGTAPHPIYRAVWLREAILGEEVPAPPADVPALSETAGESAEKAVTIKALLEQHRQKKSCNSCHAQLDPWGIPFEQYNAVGRFQPKVPKEGTRVQGFSSRVHKDLIGYQKYLESINTIPVDARSSLPNRATVDGLDANVAVVNGMQELKSYLLRRRKDDIAKNVLARLLGYGIGRKLTYRDRFIVESLAGESKTTNYQFIEMIIGICQSKTFWHSERQTFNKANPIDKPNTPSQKARK